MSLANFKKIIKTNAREEKEDNEDLCLVQGTADRVDQVEDQGGGCELRPFRRA